MSLNQAMSKFRLKEKINKLSDDIITKGQQGKFNFDGFNCLNEILFKIT